jgi:hypothetical protein
VYNRAVTPDLINEARFGCVLHAFSECMPLQGHISA